VEQLPVRPRTVEGTWIRHVPHGANLLGRADTPSDGRWQRGDAVPALYLADTVATATAEWYRSLAEWGLSPQDHIPTTIIAGALTSSLPTSATSSNCAESHLRPPDRAGAHGLPINGLVSSSGARDGPGSSPLAPRTPTRSSHACSPLTGRQPAAHRKTQAPCKPSRHHPKA
jgi:hypothetical protein